MKTILVLMFVFVVGLPYAFTQSVVKENDKKTMVSLKRQVSIAVTEQEKKQDTAFISKSTSYHQTLSSKKQQVVPVDNHIIHPMEEKTKKMKVLEKGMYRRVPATYENNE